MLFMPINTYRALPLDTLHELLVRSVKEMLEAYESQREDRMPEFNALRKQAEILIMVIEEKSPSKN